MPKNTAYTASYAEISTQTCYKGMYVNLAPRTTINKDSRNTMIQCLGSAERKDMGTRYFHD